jgi:hypothetical protein
LQNYNITALQIHHFCFYLPYKITVYKLLKPFAENTRQIKIINIFLQKNLIIMHYSVIYQERYSRGELLLRTLLGAFYLVAPHTIILFFLGLWSGLLGFIAWWSILFTGRYPESFFEYQVKYMYWQERLSARVLNISDGYPAFSLSTNDPSVTLEIPYPNSLSRGILLLRTFFGFLYVLIPHGICLLFLGMARSFLVFLAFWVVLFTGNYPKSIFDFVVGVSRWSLRVNLYMANMTDTYPPFSLD